MARRKQRQRKAQGSAFARFFLAPVSAVVATFVGFSVLWVALYGVVRPAPTALMVWRGIQGEEVSRQWRSLDEISPSLVRAVIAAEDTKFCSHHGFDLEAIQKALDEAGRGERLRGASTISQQTAKNAFLWHGRGFIRKGMEAWFTLLIETMWSKERIMEVYLNIAEWGDGYFGAEAAAHGRFGASAAQLSAYQAALMASVLPNPNEWRVAPAGPYVQRRAGTLSARMRTVAAQGLDQCVLGARS